MVLSSYAIPLSPIKKELKELSVTPAYIKAHSITSGGDDATSLNSIDIASPDSDSQYNESRTNGWGTTLSWFHALGDNWGYSINLSYAKLSGSQFVLAEYDAAGSLTKKHMADENGSATQLMGYFVYDPLTDNEKFSLPLFFGLGFYDSFQKTELTVDVNVSGYPANTTIEYSAMIDSIYYGLMVGGSFQFETGDFRWSPFIVLFFPTEKPIYDIEVTRADTNESISSYHEEESDSDPYLPSGGIGVSYKPWGLTLRYVPNIFNLMHYFEGEEEGHESIGQTVLTVTKTFSL
jgi:hypothetical protein